MRELGIPIEDELSVTNDNPELEDSEENEEER